MAKVSIAISLSSQKPIYRQIEEQLTTLIVSGVLQEGQELPSIRMLAQDLRISVITVKRAYDELEAKGFSSSVQGKGCYVSVRNREIYREEKMRLVEEKLGEAASGAKAIGMTLEELMTSLAIVYAEEKNGNGSQG